MNLDPQLLLAAQHGDRKAQSALYRTCFPALMAVCMRYQNNKQDAVAILNKGFLKIIQNLDQYKRAEASFVPWIRRIMINTVIDEFRSQKKWREQTVFIEDIERAFPDQPIDWNEADQRLDAQYLEALLQRLQPMTQKVFNLFAIDGFSHHEISEMLGMSENTSKWHVNNARTQLQSWIKTEHQTA